MLSCIIIGETMIDKHSKFYINARKMLEDYIAKGGDVNNLGSKDKIYLYIKDAKIKGESGEYLDLDTKFELLGFPRERSKSKDVKQKLIEEIDAYKQAGGSFHINRKKLPFYERLHTYSRILAKQGIVLSHEQIMKDLGYKEYSDMYFRCIGIFELQNYRDENDFVDSYRTNPKLKEYIFSLSETLRIPTYLIITLLADEKLNEIFIDVEYIEQVKTELQHYIKVNGTLKGIRRKNPKLYEKFYVLIKYCSDGVESLSAEDWLDILELGDVENRFYKTKKNEVDVENIMTKLKQKFGNSIITLKDLDSKDYYKIRKTAARLNIPIKELFRNYELQYKGNTVNRLSSTKVTEIPYLDEMLQMRDRLLNEKGFTETNGYCKEEIFEAKVRACQQVYDHFKDKMFNFTTDINENLADEELDL